jgi:hypothetical protein
MIQFPAAALKLIHSAMHLFVAYFNSNKSCILGRTIVSEDRSSVEAVVQSYFDGLYEGNADKLGAIFDPAPICAGWRKGELQV